MPGPIYLYRDLPVGGVNGFEVNGHAVNGVGYVDSPFSGVDFELDPYRSIFQTLNAGETALLETPTSVTPPEIVEAMLRDGDNEVVLQAPRIQAALECERQDSIHPSEVVSQEPSLEGVSVVPAETNRSYVLADHESTKTNVRTTSVVEGAVPSPSPDPIEITYVPAESRTTVVTREDK